MFPKSPFPELPKVVSNYILSYISEEPVRFTEQEVKHCGRILSNLVITNKKFAHFFGEKLKELKEIYTLINKYPSLNNEYNGFSKDNSVTKTLIGDNEEVIECTFFPGGNPQLIDALSTPVYTKEIGDDIKRIVTLMPNSLNCTMGESGIRMFMGPLDKACFNEKIPIEVVEFLLQNGAPINKYYYFMPMNFPLKLSDEIDRFINYGEDSARLTEIKKLFDKYK